MIRWLIMAPLSLIVSLVCYVTNPIVVLFCDEDGELPGFLSLWQTWDNSCNPSDVTDNKQLPDIFLYDWNKHYIEYKDTTPELAAEGRDRWFTTCIDNNFTLWELFQRYVCRTYWLTRNCAYGWTFWVFGVLPGIRWDIKKNDGQTKYLHEDVPFWWLDRAWCYKSTAPLFTLWGWTVHQECFLGYKVKEEAQVDTRAMIATRATVSFSKEGE